MSAAIARQKTPAIAPGPHRGRPRDPACDQAILEATVQLVSELGFERTSLDAVAARAGVSKPTIYRRWPEGKDQLVAAAVARCRADEPLVDTGSLRGDLVASMEQMISGLRENAELAAGLIQRLRESPQVAQVFRGQIVAEKRRRFEGVVRRAVERGELEQMPEDCPLLADLCPSVIHSRALLMDEPLDRRFVDQFVDRVLIPVLTAGGPAGGGR